MDILVLKSDIKSTPRKWHLRNALGNSYCSDSKADYAYQHKQLFTQIAKYADELFIDMEVLLSAAVQDLCPSNLVCDVGPR